MNKLHKQNKGKDKTNTKPLINPTKIDHKHFRVWKEIQES